MLMKWSNIQRTTQAVLVLSVFVCRQIVDSSVKFWTAVNFVDILLPDPILFNLAISYELLLV